MTSTTNPRARTRTSHHVNLDVVDGPLMEAQRGARGWHRHQITALSIAYQDGELTRVETTGPRLNVDGQKHGRGESARIDWLDELPGRHTYSDAGRAGTLREDTPEWVREAVEAHPWPSTAEIAAGWTLPGIERGLLCWCGKVHGPRLVCAHGREVGKLPALGRCTECRAAVDHVRDNPGVPIPAELLGREHIQHPDADEFAPPTR